MDKTINLEAIALESARTLLFVPGHRPDRFDKAVAAGADAIIIDLEDAVSPEQKVASRKHAQSWLARGGKAVVRINARDKRWFLDDATMATAASAIILPKAEAASDVAAVSEAVGHRAQIIPMIETVRGLTAVKDICRVPGVVRLAFGNVDFAASLGVDPASHLALQAARSAIVYASGETGCAPPIDGITTSIDDQTLLTEDTRHARELGFTGRLCIHPKQLATVSRMLSPTAKEITWAHEVLASTDTGVGVHAGHMIDEPVLVRARRIIARADAIGAVTPH